METVIYYFSSTGNSLKVARDLAGLLGNARVVPVTKVFKTCGDGAADVVGIVYPVYMFGLPLIVRDFLKTVRVKPGAYVFAAATLGGLAGRAHSLMKKMLADRGIELAAGFSVVMPGNYTPLYGAESVEHQNEMFSDEQEKVKAIADYVRQRKNGVFEERPLLLNFLLYKMFYAGGAKQIPAAAKGFWITDACTRCGLCAQVCPVENIRLEKGIPVWMDHCQHCLACLQWCPVEAIQYKKSTLGKKRYRHPAVTAQDIMGQR